TPGQVELEALGLEVCVIARLRLVLCAKFRRAERLKRHEAPFTGSGRAPGNEGDPAHPPEPIDPCCLPALGEFRGWTPRGVRPPSLIPSAAPLVGSAALGRLPLP